MKKFKVTVQLRGILTAEIDAENEEQARQIAKEMDVDCFEEVDGEGGWDVYDIIELPPLLQYEIQHDTMAGWVNTSLDSDEYGNTWPMTYATLAEAQAELDSMFEDQAERIKAGEQDAESAFSREEYRIYDRVAGEAVS